MSEIVSIWKEYLAGKQYRQLSEIRLFCFVFYKLFFGLKEPVSVPHGDTSFSGNQKTSSHVRTVVDWHAGAITEGAAVMTGLSK